MTISTQAQAAAAHEPNGVFDECLECGSDRILIVTDGEYTNFLCEGCGRCWHVDFGRVSRVDPLACPGCPDSKVCTSRLPRDDTYATNGDEIVLDLRSATSEHTTDTTGQDVRVPDSDHDLRVGQTSRR